MIRINLLPFRAARKKENIRRQVSTFLLSIGFVIVASVYYNLTLNAEIQSLGEKVESTRQELASYRKIVQEIEEIKKKLDILNQKMAVINRLEQNRREPVKLLDTLTQVVIENRMWFTRLDSNETSMKVQGVALDNRTVADFMTRLEATKLFSSVNLRTIEQTAVSNLSLMRFDIDCVKQVPSVPRPAPQKAP